ncbi:MAG: alkaline phosphatase D family protein [Planctomycetota bacterium]
MNRKRELLILVLALVLASASFGAEQYKNQTRNAMAQIVDGKVDKAIENMAGYLEKHPGDGESLYGLTVAYAQKRDIGKAIDYLEEALEAGVPFNRFIAGPRDLLEPLTKSDEFKALAKKHGSELVHGPMLGCMTESSVKFWVRTAGETKVGARVMNTGPRELFHKSVEGRTSSELDFTATLVVDGLEAHTEYDYEVWAEGDTKGREGRFKTFPAAGSKAKFKIGFGGGAGYTPQYERMWNTIASHNLTAFLFLGDNVYIDHPTRQAVQKYCYYRRQSRPEYRNFIASTPLYAIWDDHDFTTNDSQGGPEVRVPEWKIPVWRTFMNNWVNPYYAGGTEEEPGCWFDFSIGDVHFIMLDGRYYRENPRKIENPSMLGPVQKKWLFEKLKGSTGTFKILASPVPWAFGVKPGSKDPWQGFKAEREEIFSFLEDNKIEGVLLISADRHRSEARIIKREIGYKLYEFESSKLTNIHTHGLIRGEIFGYNKKCSVGMLTFDTTPDDPEITYDIVNIDNELIHTLTLKKSALKHEK